MSQLEQGYRADSLRKGGGARVAPANISESFATPGLDITPPVVSNTTNQLLDILGIASSTIGYMGRQAEEERATQERYAAHMAALSEKERRQVEMADAGRAALDFQTMYPQVEDDFLTGKVKAPEDEGAFIADFIARNTAGASPAYADKFRELAQPRLADQIVKQRQRIRADSLKEYETDYRNAAVAASSPAELGDVLIAAKGVFGDRSDNEIMGALFVPALRQAAQVGDVQRFNNVKALLGDRFLADQQDAQLRLDAHQSAATEATNRAFRDDIAGQILNGTPWEAIRDRAMSWRDKVGDNMVESEVSRIDAQIRQRDEQIRERAIGQYKQDFTTATIGDAAANMNAGLDFLVTDKSSPLVDKNGKPLVTLTRADQLEQAYAQATAAIDRETSDPDIRANKRMTLLTKSPTVTDPGWKALFGGVSRTISSDTDLNNLPPKIATAYAEWQRLGAMNATVRDAHMDESDRKFFEMIDFAQRNVTGGDPAAAIQATVKMMRDNPGGGNVPTNIAKELIDPAIEDGPDNIGDARANIERQARVYMLGFGKDAETATKFAVENFKKKWKAINGSWVNVAGRPVANSVDMDAIDTTLAKFMNAEGVKIGPTADGQQWTMYSKISGLPVPNAPRLQDTDLQVIHQWLNWPETIKDAERRRQKMIQTETDLRVNAEFGSQTLLSQFSTAMGGESPEDLKSNLERRNAIIQRAADATKLTEPTFNARIQPIIDFINAERAKAATPKVPAFINERAFGRDIRS